MNEASIYLGSNEASVEMIEWGFNVLRIKRGFNILAIERGLDRVMIERGFNIVAIERGFKKATSERGFNLVIIEWGFNIAMNIMKLQLQFHHNKRSSSVVTKQWNFDVCWNGMIKYEWGLDFITIQIKWNDWEFYFRAVSITKKEQLVSSSDKNV